jgi:hypothetical protein
MAREGNPEFRRRADPGHSAGRTLAALLGAPLTAAALSVAMARGLPLSRGWSTAWAYQSMVPVWVLLACVLPLQSSGKRAWMLCAVLALIAASIALIGSHLR